MISKTVSKFSIAFIVASFLMVLGAANVAFSADEMQPAKKVVIQVSTDDEQTQTIAMNNAVNIQKLYGVDNIAIEIVAYGPGLGMLTANSKQSPRVKSLAMQNITFSACGNTMQKVAKKTGKEPKLTEGVKIVEAGVARIIDLQDSGYAYVRP